MSMGGKLVDVVCVRCGRVRSIPQSVVKRAAKRWRCLECRSKGHKRKPILAEHKETVVPVAPVKKYDFRDAVKKLAFPCQIIHDPDQIGGFRAGMKLSQIECETMIYNNAFTENTVVSDEGGKQFRYSERRMIPLGEKR